MTTPNTLGEDPKVLGVVIVSWTVTENGRKRRKYPIYMQAQKLLPVFFKNAYEKKYPGIGWGCEDTIYFRGVALSSIVFTHER